MVAPSAAASLEEREFIYETEDMTKSNRKANRKDPALPKAALRTKHGAQVGGEMPGFPDMFFLKISSKGSLT